MRTTNGKRGGNLVGKPHNDKSGNPVGGIKAQVTDAGGKPVELEGGEVIINKEASKKYWKELSKINQSAGNGVPIEKPIDPHDEDPSEYEEGGKIIEFNRNHLPNKWILSYAKSIKKDHPEIWKLGGNIYGNTAFENLSRVAERGYWLDSEEWMYKKWQSFLARHQHDFRIAGVVAVLKWGGKVNKGWAFMKNLIEDKIKKGSTKPKSMKDGGSVEFKPEKKGTLIKGSEIIKYAEKVNGNYRLMFYSIKESRGKVPILCDAFDYCKKIDVSNVSPNELIDLIEKNNLMEKGGKLIKRADGSYSKRGLWDNIRDNAGSGKEPTREMLEQEAKIKAVSMRDGGNLLVLGEIYSGKKVRDAVSKYDSSQGTDMEAFAKENIKLNDKYVLEYVDVQDLIPSDSCLDTFISDQYDDSRKVQYREIEEPILLGTNEYNRLIVLDGYHRVLQTIYNNEDKILAYKKLSVSKNKYADGGSSEYLNVLQKVGITEEQRENWRESHYVNQRQVRNDKVKEAAEKLKNGTIPQNEYLTIVAKEQPIKLFKEVPTLPSAKEIVSALDKNKVKDGVVGYTKHIEDGTKVASRLDIPAYEYYDTWVVSIHDGITEKIITYGQTAYLKNVEFKTYPKTALLIATGNTKSTIGRMYGAWENKSPNDVRKMAVKYMNDPNWVQVGMNPFRHSWFYDKKDGMPLVSSSEVIQVGALVLAKNPVKTTPDNDMFIADKKNPSIKFDKGGLIAPNGEKSNLTAEQYKLVRTKAFKDWFGDWENDPKNSSKVVDDNGEPLVVYHGSPYGEFSVFKNEVGIGDFWFTSEINLAKTHTIKSRWDRKDTIPYMVEAFLNIKNPTYGYTTNWKFDEEKTNDGSVKVTTSFGNNVYVAYYPEQIKLADGSNTTFDGSSPDIRFKDGGEIRKGRDGQTIFDDVWLLTRNEYANENIVVHSGDSLKRNRHPLENYFQKSITDVQHKNRVQKAIDEGKYEKAIKSGILTSERANEIIKSADLGVKFKDGGEVKDEFANTMKLIDEIKKHSFYTKGTISTAKDGQKYRYDSYKLKYPNSANWLVQLFEKASEENTGKSYHTQFNHTDKYSFSFDRARFKGMPHGRMGFKELVLM
jgi:hypothetical protein